MRSPGGEEDSRNGGGIGAPVGLLVLLTLVVSLLFAASASAYFIPVMGKVTKVSYNSAHATAIASSDEFINVYNFEASTDGGATWNSVFFGLYLGAADERPIEADLKLKGGTHYAIRFTLSGAGGVVSSPAPYPEFTTLPVDPPENVSLGAPAADFSLSAELSGKVKRPANPDSAFDIECRFEYISDEQFGLTGFEGATVAPCEPNPVKAPGVESTVTAKLTGLTASTTYHQRLVAENASPEVITAVGPNFTTQPTVAKPKVLSVNDPAEVSYRTAKLSGVVERPAGADPALDTYCRFEVVTEAQFLANGFAEAGGPNCDQTYVPDQGPKPIATTGPTPVTVTIGLQSGVTYYWRLTAENAAGPEYKEAADPFTTIPGGEATATIDTAPAMGYTTVELTATVNRGLGPAQTEGLRVAFEYAEVGTENWAGYPEQIDVPVEPGPISISHEFTGLTPNTEYQFRVDRTGDFNGYGQTLQDPPYLTGKTKVLAEPAVSFGPVTDVTANTAHFSGDVTTNAPPGPLEKLAKAAYKTFWEVQCEPACPGNSGVVEGEEGSEVVALDAVGLEANTYYEAKLVAHNAFYTVESPIQPFQTPLVAPTVTSATGASDGLGGYFLEGVVDSNNTKVTTCKFEYGTTATYPNTYEAPCLPNPSGPDEVQQIGVDATEGQFTLKFRGQTTTDLAYNATPAEVQTALRALTKIGPKGVNVSGTPQAYKVTFAGALGGANVEPIKGGDGGTPLGGGGGINVSTETEGGILHPVSVEAHLEALTPGSTYHFRIVATSAGGTSTTSDRIFIPTLAPQEPPCPNQQARAENSSGALPECRAYEMVSSPFKVGYSASFGTFSNGEGTNVLYSSGAPNISKSGEGGLTNSYVSTRTAAGWETIPNKNGPTGSFFSPPYNIEVFGFDPGGQSADLLSSLNNLKKKGDSVQSLYLRKPDGSFVLVGRESDDYIINSSMGEGLVGKSDDLSHIFYQGRVANYSVFGEGLYEFIGLGNDQPFQVDLDNNGKPVTNCEFPGSFSTNVSGNSVSRDGRVLVYTARGCAKTTTFTPTMEKDQVWAHVGLQKGSQVSYYLSASKCTRTSGDPGGACNETADARFEAATPNGSRVFFSTTQQLVNEDTDETRDLYACDLPAGEAAPSGAANPCSALTLVSGAATGADVENLIRISADGSIAYFVAKGVLADNTDAFGDAAVAGGNNLYAWKQTPGDPGGETTFIANLVENDLISSFDSSGPQVTPSGRYLVFATSSRLILTDNDTARDIYRYDDDSGELTRVSTGVSGTGGNGQFDAAVAPAGQGSSGPGTSGALSDDGTKIVFSTEEALSPLDGNKAADAYLWSEGHVYLISTGAARGGSNKIVITPSGRDIYFQTPAALVPADGDLLNDVYDARIGGGFTNPPAGCAGEACKPPAVPGVSAESPPSTVAPGAGNPPPPKGCPKGKVLKKGKCVKKPKKAKKHKKRKSHKRANSSAGGGK